MTCSASSILETRQFQVLHDALGEHLAGILWRVLFDHPAQQGRVLEPQTGVDGSGSLEPRRPDPARRPQRGGQKAYAGQGGAEALEAKGQVAPAA
jgi:hypothetical protein